MKPSREHICLPIYSMWVANLIQLSNFYGLATRPKDDKNTSFAHVGIFLAVIVIELLALCMNLWCVWVQEL